MQHSPGSPAMVAIRRSGVVEGWHHASAVVTSPGGEVLRSWGAVDSPILPRSVNKPLQTLGMLAAGLDLPADQLTVATSSHSAEPRHLELVRAILASAGLDESALRTPPSWPCDPVEERAWAASGREPEPIGMDCSGKHAAMLWTCIHRGWEVADYLHPAHPLQQEITDRFFRELGRGRRQDPVAVDGCGAPILAASLRELASFYGALAAAPGGGAEHEGAADPRARLATALVTHPDLLSGTRRDDAALMRALPGAIAKSGAEAVYALGLSDGHGVALKIADGGDRARPVLMAAILAELRALGVLDDAAGGVDAEAVRRTGEHVVYGGGRRVGELVAVLDQNAPLHTDG